MKKLIILVLLIGGGYVGYLNWNEDILADYSLQALAVENNVTNGELVLVNREYAFNMDPDNLMQVEQGSSNSIRIMGHMQMQPVVYEQLMEMADAAVADGITNLQLNSAYRSAIEQAKLFAEYGASYALPAGHSEHQTGLAVDISVTSGKIEGTEAAKWLEKNAAKFGFVLRYPANKVHVTDIEFEPWHFRYVGLPHSLIMEKENLVLEEYLEYLRNKEAYKATFGEIDYIIQYVQVDESAPHIDVPKSDYYMTSSDNIGGVIVTTKILKE